jgi:N-acetyl-gamma-glutamyl-phosphate reductase
MYNYEILNRRHGMNRVSVIGSTGYVGAEIVRLLSEHPFFELSVLASRSYKGEKYSDIYQSLKGKVDNVLEDIDTERICRGSDYVVTALPHGISSQTVPVLLENGVKVLDHSGDYRFKNINAYLKAYKIDHSSPEYLDEAVYGLPELYREKISGARLVANPGCYPTCSILGIAPLLMKKLISPSNIVINGVSGVSGAGRSEKLEYSFCETAENFKAYSPVGHRHTAEIEQEYSLLYGSDVSVTFTPHLAPMKRGMLCTIYADLAYGGILGEDIESVYNDAYSSEYFIRFLGEGKMPQTRSVAGSNYADISFAINNDTNKIIIFSALDNLGKGASSQAVQCLNIMAGFEEDAGLTKSSLYI